MSKFFWLQDVCVRLSEIKMVSKVKQTGPNAGFTVSDAVRYRDDPIYVHYNTLAEAVAVHSALLEALENDDA